MEQNIGKLIKELRKTKKMKLKEVAEKSGLTISFISQVERSVSSVTLHSLRKISEALDVSPSYFFPDLINKESNMIRRGMNEEPELTSSFIYSSLSGNVSNPVFYPAFVTLLPGDIKETPFAHQGQEFIYVMSGVLTIILDQSEYDLYPGDSLHMESTVPHNWFNKTDQPTKFIFVSTGTMITHN